MKVPPGSRWKSAVCPTEVVVVKPPKQEGELSCGGAPMLPIAAERPAGGAPVAGQDGGTLLGKRYGDDVSALELLCTKGGAGTLRYDGRALDVRVVKPLPSSD
jgi:hypothetical protein